MRRTALAGAEAQTGLSVTAPAQSGRQRLHEPGCSAVKHVFSPPEIRPGSATGWEAMGLSPLA